MTTAGLIGLGLILAGCALGAWIADTAAPAVRTFDKAGRERVRLATAQTTQHTKTRAS